MSLDPKDDPTSLGAILLEMGTIEQAQLDEAIEQQERSTIEVQIGNQLVVLGHCNKAQIDLALAAQEKLRKGQKHEHALAVVDIALARKKSTEGAQRQMIETSQRVARKAGTGRGFRAITAGMLAKASDER